jgi:hypothetical protein
VDGWFEALNTMQKQPHQAAVVMAKREHLSPAQFERALQGLRFYDLEQNRAMLTGPSPGLRRTAQRLGGVMVANRLLERSPDLSDLIDGSYVKGVLP